MRNRLLGACALALAATSLSATPAAASTATVAGPNVYYGAAPGETNQVTVAADCEPGCAEVTITDAGATITPGAGCSQGIDAHQVTCDLTALGLTGGILVLADLSDMNDSAEATADASCGCQGGSGDDVFKRTGIGPLGNGVMAYGGPGDDSFHGSPGAESVVGGPGDDTLIEQSGGQLAPAGSCDHFNDSEAYFNDGSQINGSGMDTVDFSARQDPVAVSIRRRAAFGCDVSGRFVVAGPEIDRIVGGSGADELAGNQRRNLLAGGPGDDRIEGNGGNDLLQGADGNDLLAGGSGIDELSGGAGSDGASYARRVPGVTARIGGNASDAGNGASPVAQDAIEPDVENLIGGRGPDRLIGDGLANVLAGGPGADTLLGRGGADLLRARDGIRDLMLDCGPGADRIRLDPGLDPRPLSC